MYFSDQLWNYCLSYLSWFLDNAPTLIFIAIVAIVTVFIARLTNRLLDKYLMKKALKLNIDIKEYNLLRHFGVASIYLIGLIIIIYSIPQLRSLSMGLFAGAGFAGIILGFAAQTTLRNIISGISLAVFTPFRVGDLVTIHEEYGTISDLTLRHTVMTTWDNRRLIIPNSIISEEAIINWSIEDPTVIWPVDIGISYDSNIDKARSIIIDEANKHPETMDHYQVSRMHPEIMEGNENRVRVAELGDFAVNLRLLFWVRDRNIAYSTGCELRESIKKRFDAEGIEIPFPYRTIVYKKDIHTKSGLENSIESTQRRGNEFHFQDTQEQSDGSEDE